VDRGWVYHIWSLYQYCKEKSDQTQLQWYLGQYLRAPTWLVFRLDLFCIWNFNDMPEKWAARITVSHRQILVKRFGKASCCEAQRALGRQAAVRRTEAWRAEAGVGFLRWGQPSPFPPAMVITSWQDHAQYRTLFALLAAYWAWSVCNWPTSFCW